MGVVRRWGEEKGELLFTEYGVLGVQSWKVIWKWMVVTNSHCEHSVPLNCTLQHGKGSDGCSVWNV